MRQQSITLVNEKLEAFDDCLSTGAEAEVWLKALPTTPKATWSTFITVFELCWPPIIIVEKTKAEYEKELLERLLADAETHITWTAKVLQLATSAGIEASTSMIWQVHGCLPTVIKDLSKDEEYKDWAEFMKNVTELKSTQLLDKKEQYTRQE
ncbi:hypothetical protein DFH29DRAFT_870807 [Suillus ampliporus]|nr:hypothetical protein DFH29DRAFT_870807 [Suillus ampliporus]